MSATLDEHGLAEVRAVLESDLRASGAGTAEALRDAAIDSLMTLLPEPHVIVVEPCPHRPRWFTVRIEGPSLIGGIPIHI